MLQETAPVPLIFEYDNQSKPKVVVRKEKTKSPKDKKRKHRSPTPPSAYSLDRRSPSRPSPSRWTAHPGAWSGVRDRTPPWQRFPRDRAAPSRRSRSRSPHRKDEKKKKHRRLKSKSPSRKDRTKDRSRNSQEKPKVKSKDKEKKKKEKSRHKNRDQDARHAHGKSSRKNIIAEEVNNDFEILRKSPPDLMQIFSESKTAARNGRNCPDLKLESVHLSTVPSGSLHSVESDTRQLKSLAHSENTDDVPAPFSRLSSQCNSPATLASSVSRGSSPSRSSTDITAMDLMSKVRAMLKKSREMIHKEEGHSMDDT
uniref:Uncharacterized protein n=1 Tax=Arion vulgaris TaxID=1028688 RepID=A0A0B7BAR0_9EUPU